MGSDSGHTGGCVDASCWNLVQFFTFSDLLHVIDIDYLLLHWQEYVVVLLRNGRRKDEARSELDVFLGDDSDSFVSW